MGHQSFSDIFLAFDLKGLISQIEEILNSNLNKIVSNIIVCDAPYNPEPDPDIGIFIEPINEYLNIEEEIKLKTVGNFLYSVGGIVRKALEVSNKIYDERVNYLNDHKNELYFYFSNKKIGGQQ